MAHTITFTVTRPNAETASFDGGALTTAMEAALQAEQDAGRLKSITTDTDGLVTTAVLTYDSEASADAFATNSDYVAYAEARNQYNTDNGITTEIQINGVVVDQTV